MNADGLLPDPVAAELLARWSEPHRRYHSRTHLGDGLEALDILQAGRLERVAFWFHDAVHRNASPDDELASAALARDLLAHLPIAEVDEVCRLILVTVDHAPRADDAAGARMADADLHGLGLPWERYRANVAAIRAELPTLGTPEWAQRRRRFVERMLKRGSVFNTPKGLALWEHQARINLQAEADQLSASSW